MNGSLCEAILETAGWRTSVKHMYNLFRIMYVHIEAHNKVLTLRGFPRLIVKNGRKKRHHFGIGLPFLQMSLKSGLE